MKELYYLILVSNMISMSGGILIGVCIGLGAQLFNRYDRLRIHTFKKD